MAAFALTQPAFAVRKQLPEEPIAPKSFSECRDYYESMMAAREPIVEQAKRKADEAWEHAKEWRFRLLTAPILASSASRMAVKLALFAHGDWNDRQPF